jgi:ADP-ribose pyrophosphatase
MYQFPANAIDKNETPKAAAKRELQEETGYTSSNVSFLSKSAPFPTKATGYNYAFLAQNATLTSTPHHDEMEPTEVHNMPSQKLIELIENGEFAIGSSLIPALLVLRKFGL